MQKTPKPFKSSPKRYHPRGLSIVYEDHDILVVDKAGGILTIGTDDEKESSAHYLLNGYVRKGNSKSKNRVFIVHRLDRETSGLLVFAKSEAAKIYLQEEWHSFTKIYYAVVDGYLPEKKGELVSYLTDNTAYKMYSVQDPEEGKLARTGYKVLKQGNRRSLLEIKLHTGRKNQIRVQLADIRCPVVGDEKYGRFEKGVRRLALRAASLKLRHPHTKEWMTFEAKEPPFFRALTHSF